MKPIPSLLTTLCLVLVSCQPPAAPAAKIPLRPVEARDITLKADYIRVGNVDQKPKPLEGPGPVYPAELRLAGVEGLALMVVSIDSTGRVREVQTGTATDERFSRSARHAILQWKYSPAMKAGKRVGCSFLIPVHFRLRDPRSARAMGNPS